MNDRGKIIFGLVVFIVIMTFPLWYNIANSKATYRPEPEILTKGVPGKEQCVLPTLEMKEQHMNLLNRWRDTVVRDGKRVYASPDGRKMVMSLSHTCMDCHSNKADFCDRCHNYLAVSPYCWECHIDPKELPR